MRDIRHIIRTQDFSRSWLETRFFKEVELMEKLLKEKNGPFLLKNVLVGKSVILLFQEKSPRTRVALETGAQKLGANVVFVEGDKREDDEPVLPYSSRSGEGSFEDMVKTYALQGHDCIVIRSAKEGLASEAAQVVEEFNHSTSIINAGDGPGQHPAQALIDLYTIRKDFGAIDGLTGILLGNLRDSRVMRSNAYLWSKFNVKMFLVSPSQFSMRSDIIEHFKEHGVDYEEVLLKDISKLKKVADFVYAVNIPGWRERCLFVIDKKFVREYLKKHGKVYHPFPRRDEIVGWKTDNKEAQRRTIDKMPQAGFWHQIANAAPVYMTLLKMCLAPALDLQELLEN